MRRWRALAFYACTKCISAAANRQPVCAVRALPHLEEEFPYLRRRAIGNVCRPYRASPSWLLNIGRQPEDSSTSSWDVDGNPKQTSEIKPGNTKDNTETPATSLGKETNTREMFHAKAKETEERLSHEGKLPDSSPEIPQASSTIIGENEGQSVWALGMKVTIKCRGEDTDGSYSCMEYQLAPGDGSQTHTHTQEDETWYMLEGDMEWSLQNRLFSATKGSFLRLPSGIPHSFRNTSSQPARMLVSCVPAGLEKYFLEIGAPVDPSPGAKRPAVSEEDAKIATQAGRKYGLTFSEQHPSA